MSQVTSPFKFLDSYSREDADIFFGREQETEALYDALSGVKHLLVYGPSGAGKTSLIECGLRNQFSDADWFALTIRKGANISGSVFLKINEALDEKIPLHRETGLPEDKDEEIDFKHAIECLFAERYQPIYLLFDQFEELLISGDQAEKEDFFARLNSLIRHKVPCRVMLIMREEFIGHLSEFEPLCPSIFQHRFRLEKMRKDSVKEVIRKTLDAPKYAASFTVEDSEGLAASILSKLPDKKREIELAHVQVFLNELWGRAHKDGEGTGALPMLRQSLIDEEDNLEGVLDSFLKKQLKELEAVHGEKIPLEVLAAMISERHTKLQVSEEDLYQDLESEGIALPKNLPLLLRDLESRRIIRTLKAGEKTQYEISHDVLALVVGQNLTIEMQQREEATRVYKVYEGKQGNLSPEDLDHIRSYQLYKALPVALKKKVEESVANNARKDAEKLEEAQRQAEQERKLRGKAEENEKQARQRTRLAAGISIVALVLALFAGWSFLQAQKALDNLEKKKADEVKLILKNAERDVYTLNYEDALEKIKAAASLGTLKPEVTKAWLEIAFWHGEAGNTQRAAVLLDSAAALVNKPVTILQPFRESIKTFDPDEYEKLMERYYPEMVEVEGGVFDMGCDPGDSCSDLHKQEVSSFKMAKYETTWWQYYLFCKATGHEYESPGWGTDGDNPAVNVHWYDAAKYASWVSERKGYIVSFSEYDMIDNKINPGSKGYRLPTEAEWEYAAKGGKYHSYNISSGHTELDSVLANIRSSISSLATSTLYSGHSELDSVGWYFRNSAGHPWPIGKKKANALGLFDMSGNVSEWCCDFFANLPENFVPDYCFGKKEDGFFGVRGGSWRSFASDCRVAYREYHCLGFSSSDLGFRLVLVP